MTSRTVDLGKLREFVDADPVRNAVVAQRIFYPHQKTEFFVDDENRIEAAAAIEIPGNDWETRSMAFQANTIGAARELVFGLPEGKYWFHLANEEVFPVVRERMKMGWYAKAWLLSLDAGEFKAESRHKTARIDVRWAHRIASIWSLDWNADEYVKSRLENGPSAGVFVDGELVAWDLSHFETEKVSMLGFLNVLPEYRGRGYAASVTIDCVRQVLAKDKIAACHIYEHNEASLRLCEGLGFGRVCKQIWGDAVTR